MYPLVERYLTIDPQEEGDQSELASPFFIKKHHLSHEGIVFYSNQYEMMSSRKTRDHWLLFLFIRDEVPEDMYRCSMNPHEENVVTWYGVFRAYSVRLLDSHFL